MTQPPPTRNITFSLTGNAPKSRRLRLTSAAAVALLGMVASGCAAGVDANTPSSQPSQTTATAAATATNLHLGATSQPVSIAALPSGSATYIADLQSNHLIVVDTKAFKEVAKVAIDHPISVAISPDSKWVAVVGEGPKSTTVLKVLDTATNKVEKTLSVPSISSGVTFSADSKKIYATGWGPKPILATVVIADNKLSTVLLPTTHGLPGTITVSPDGNYAFVLNNGADDIADISDNGATLINLSNNQATSFQFDTQQGSFGTSAAFSADSKTVYIGQSGNPFPSSGSTGANRVITYDPVNQKQTAAPVTLNQSEQSTFTPVSVSPSGNEVYLGLASSDATSALWMALTPVTNTVRTLADTKLQVLPSTMTQLDAATWQTHNGAPAQYFLQSGDAQASGAWLTRVTP